MKKKNLIAYLLSALVIAFSGIMFSACGGKKVTGIYLQEGSYQTTVVYNGNYDYDSIVVMAKLSNGEEMQLDSADYDIVDRINTQVVGEQELTITYGAYEVSVTVTVYAEVESFSVKAGTIPTEVYHKEVLDVSNAVLSVSYTDGTTAEISTGFEIGTADTSTCGVHTVTISFAGKTINFSYNVKKVVESIEPRGNYLTRIAYGSTYNYSGITALVHYSDGTSEEVANSKLTITKIDTNKIGVQTIVVTYNGKQTNIDVEVYKEMTSIEYKSGLVTRIKYNTTLDLSNLVITVNYSNNTSEDVAFSQDNTISARLLSQDLGDTQIEISYNGKTTLVNVTVYEELEFIVISPVDVTDVTTGYVVKDGSLDLSKFKVVAHYTKNQTNLDNSQVSFSNLDTSEIGDKTLEVSFTDNGITKTTSVIVHIVASWEDVKGLEIDSIEIVNGSVNTEVDHNGVLNLENLQIEISYTNGLKGVIDYASHQSEISVSTIDTTTCGKQTLTVTYKEKQTTLDIQVVRVATQIVVKTPSILKVKCGTNVDLSDVVITCTYSNGDVEDLTSLPENNADEIDTTKLGTDQVITFTYKNQNCELPVEIYDEIEELVNIQGVVLVVEYGTNYVTSNITASVRYASGLEVALNNSDLTFSTINTSLLDEQTLTISYTLDGKTINAYINNIVVKDVLESIEIKGVQTVCYQGDDYDMSGLIVVLSFRSGAVSEVTSGYTVLQDISTNEIGVQTLEIEYQGKKATKQVTVNKTYTITGFNDPKFVTDYNSNKKLKNEFTSTDSTGTKGFEITNVSYKVGDDNEFIYSPILAVKTKDNENVRLTEYKAIINVYILDNDEYTLLDSNMDEYVTFNDTLHTFNFTDKAVGNKFQIKMLPYGMTDAEKAIVTERVFEFEVVDGWNAYSAKDISLIDNMNEKDKWTEYKTANNISLNQKISSIILHDNITLKDSDLPASQFLGSDEVKESDSDYNIAFGSLKDEHSSDYGFIYHRQIADGETFTIEGNYFRLSAEYISKIVREEVDGVRRITGEGEAITVHTSLFGFSGDVNSTVKGQGYIKNIHLIGNTQKSEDALMSGGVMAMKVRNTNFTFDNILSQRWFISFMVEGANDYSDGCSHIFKNVNAFDAYNTLLYSWGARNVQIIDSHFIGAGGPVMICDHVDNNKSTGEGGYITNVKVSNSVLESFVAGSEGWFATYEGASALAFSIKAMNALITPYGNTLCDKSNQKINLIAVYKSGSVQGLSTSVIRGSFEDTKETYDNGLDLSSEGIATTKNQVINKLLEDDIKHDQIASVLANMAILQTFNGEVGVPGTSGWYSDSLAPDQTKFAQADGYMNVYLFNGMAAVLGMTKTA